MEVNIILDRTSYSEWKMSSGLVYNFKDGYK